ncbi:hypothetical protein BDP27DRAFT_1371699 [Rhodocollybia butyracea]|uniref:Uncharacterized protein n=1 Tax=Rhodocollybia butyracea TaxID=206335 RepID=A0A9P5TXX7_9AGAR|nr:hypothetical protein BDP27DRAFT_1371699 [Rhodocollybia butyracea]
MSFTDEELAHPGVKILQRISSPSPKDKMANYEGQNGVSMIRKYGLVSTEEEALAEVSNIILWSSKQFKEITERALSDPMLSSEIKRWIAALPSTVSRNACTLRRCAVAFWGETEYRY